MARVSFTGRVFGIAQTWAKPPAAAAARPLRDVLLVLLARLAQVRVQVDEAGEQERAAALDDAHALAAGRRPVAPRRGPTRVMAPPSTTTSTSASSPREGSTARTRRKTRTSCIGAAVSTRARPAEVPPREARGADLRIQLEVDGRRRGSKDPSRAARPLRGRGSARAWPRRRPASGSRRRAAAVTPSRPSRLRRLAWALPLPIAVIIRRPMPPRTRPRTRRPAVPEGRAGRAADDADAEPQPCLSPRIDGG